MRWWGEPSAKTEDRAGVTRQLQWFRLSPGIELMDTPGVLPPKISSGASSMEARYLRRRAAGPLRSRGGGRSISSLAVARSRDAKCPTSTRSRRARGFVRRGGRSTITMRRIRTLARSTTARLGASRSRRPMTPKQRKAKNAYERERRRLHRLHQFENAARARGFTLVAGIDEVGRGPLAGPVVAACVVAESRSSSGDSTIRSRCAPRLRVAMAETSQAAGNRVGRRQRERRRDRPAEHLLGQRARDGARDRRARDRCREYLITDAVRIRSYTGPQEPLVHGDARCARRRRRLHLGKGASRRADGRARSRGRALRVRAA